MLNLPFLAVVKVDSQGTIMETAGNWEKLGLSLPKVGCKIDDAIDVFSGYFEYLGTEKVHLPFIRTENDKYINFDVIPEEGNFFITALDVTREAQIAQELQQVRNQIELLKREIFQG